MRHSFDSFGPAVDIDSGGESVSQSQEIQNTSDALVSKVRRLVEQAYMTDVKDTLGGRYHWRKVGDWSEALARICAGISTMLAFASGIYELKALSFAAGCTNTMAIVLGLWVSYAVKESKERSRDLNKVLSVLQVSPMPDLSNSNTGSLLKQ